MDAQTGRGLGELGRVGPPTGSNTTRAPLPWVISQHLLDQILLIAGDHVSRPGVQECLPL